jgi:uncharacterized protein (DUF1501 family)
MEMAQSRRQFLRHAACGTLSASALLGGLGRFALIDALAKPPSGSGYRALVCIFLYGGNDSNNTVIPLDDYALYSAVRGASGIAIPHADLLSILPPSAGRQFGLHPALTELHSLWLSKNLAVVCNAGTLTNPLTHASYLAGASRPYQLFSHSDQQNQWQTAYSNNPIGTGWGGRVVDQTSALSSDGRFPVIASVAGVTVFSTGTNTRPIVLSPAPTPLNKTLALLKSDQAWLDVLTSDGVDVMPTLVHNAAHITSAAVDDSLLLNSNPSLTTVFPNTSLGNQLKQVAKLIQLATTSSSLGLDRQIFFCSLGGFDTHTNQGNITGIQASLLKQVSQAVAAFFNATVELRVASQVTTFTASDFSRTFKPAGVGAATGTDHAWGSHQFVVGGGVAGGNFYGAFPDLILGGKDDADAGTAARGRWIPAISVDQYAATLALWYGLPTSELTTVFPNVTNFNKSNLGFMA